ncbi:MAG: hypothetical protein GAK31_03080 [Stenotrophomonas maltophilia]|uniref:RDD domain-containing protein n=1 Tax=Stenotrophomonas maltophilia TaxID=40324 RepID=A0A7V8JKV9_STEMA|nr:MAG: hypothetical protein GAK31_03080 [Stenotrophomonas maltophilia]
MGAVGVQLGLAGLYATLSWQRGGQTMGMRPWRLRLQSSDGAPLRAGQLWRRYAVGTLSLLAGGWGSGGRCGTTSRVR